MERGRLDGNRESRRAHQDGSAFYAGEIDQGVTLRRFAAGVPEKGTESNRGSGAVARNS